MEGAPAIVLAASGLLFEKTAATMQEARARGQVVRTSDREGIAEVGEGCMAVIEMPKVYPLIAPLVYPRRLIAGLSRCRGIAVNQLWNLARSVAEERLAKGNVFEINFVRGPFGSTYLNLSVKLSGSFLALQAASSARNYSKMLLMSVRASQRNY